MPATKSSRVRERRISQEIVVDAYNSSETALSWFYYLEEAIDFPFSARCVVLAKGMNVKRGELVTVLSLASEEECVAEIRVVIEASGCRFPFPLAKLSPVGVRGLTKQATGDWKYWVARGYEF